MKKLSTKVDTNLSIEESFAYYMKRCTIKNLSAETIKSYKVHYHVFEKFIGGQTQIRTIDSDTIGDFILYLKENNHCNEITINSYLRTIRAYLYYCMETGYLSQFTVHIQKVDKKIKETYNEQELKLLLKKPKIKHCDFGEYRTWVFSNYLLATGNRISSVLNIKIEDLDFMNSLITVNKMKNRKAQIIPMSQTLSEVLQEYLQYRGGDPTDYVFCTVTGEKSALRSYQDALGKYNKSRGVMKTSAHLYRHTFAKQWILNGGDIFRLQKLLGHSDLSVVKEYVQMFGNDLSVDFDKFNPLETLGMNQQKNTINMRK